MERGKIGDIVIVEDNRDDSFMLVRLLQRAQIDEHATVLEDGYQALRYLNEQTRLPLVIFLDLRLPGLTGIALLEEIRKEPRWRNIPVVVMTGSHNPKDVQECERLGITAFLPKPIALSTFIKTVAHLFPLTTDRN